MKSRAAVLTSRALAGAVMTGMLIIALVPHASAAPRPKPVAGTAAAVAVVAPDLIREDRQTRERALVVFSGIDAKTRVRVDFGDGAPIETPRGRCAVPFAVKNPSACTIEIPHWYREPGTYTITASVGSTVVQKAIAIAPAPAPWSAPADWIQPAGWSLLGRSAQYLPCQTVEWFVDRASQPANTGRLVEQVPTALAMIAAETNLAFVETTDPLAADLTFNWGETGAAGRGGFGRVTFDVDHSWATDEWVGFGPVVTPSGWRGIGNGWLIIHEVLHAMGLGHVNDRNQVMNPVIVTAAFGSGDLEGLHTMYRDVLCPVE